ncbi:LIM domain only protein 3-like isoform X3 [Vespula squamosa]|uniref:LIM domain only protein 3-like isoform X3 n=1 Tax=Vespula squamosa TaxID=30214 RepID=A0ABD2C152_VESSQ
MQVGFALDCIGRSCETDSPAIRELGVVLLRESTGNLHLKELEEFCVGDQFYLYENKILCEYHYKERVYFANMPHPPPNDTLAHIKRQVTHLQPQTVPAGGPPRQANGETAHNHNGYPAPATSSAHNVLNPMNNLNGINAQAPYDAK